jgi:hypothetical protein
MSATPQTAERLWRRFTELFLAAEAMANQSLAEAAEYHKLAMEFKAQVPKERLEEIDMERLGRARAS